MSRFNGLQKTGRGSPQGRVSALALTLALTLTLGLAPTAGPAQTIPAGTTPSAAKPATAYSAGVAHDWFSLALLLVQQTPGFSPPVASRALAYLSLALYESVVPGMPQHQSLAGQLNELSSLPWAQPDEVLHWPTVANAAMATMTRMMFPTASAENKGRMDLLERSIPLKYNADFDPAAVTPEITNRSQSFGKLMAMALMTWARTDGGHEGWAPLRRDQKTYIPPGGAGQWSATPPAFAPALLPYWGDNRPFVLPQADACPAPAYPPYSETAGSAFYKEGLEVYQIATQATQEQRQFALYWADDAGKTPTPAGHWAFIANDLLKNRKASLGDTAHAMAALNLAMSDAFVAAWYTKYTANLLRPVTYIQLGIDSNWVPQLMHTPPFPEYPSGHSVQSSAAASVLAQFLGGDTAFVDNTHNDRGWGPRTFPSFAAAANEAALSRLYAGIHFRSGVAGGQVQGRCVATKVLALQFRRPP